MKQFIAMLIVMTLALAPAAFAKWDYSAGMAMGVDVTEDAPSSAFVDVTATHTHPGSNLSFETSLSQRFALTDATCGDTEAQNVDGEPVVKAGLRFNF